MEIIFNRLYRIDIEKNHVTAMPLRDELSDLKSYVYELVTKILISSDSKSFQFNSETTEVRVLIDKILNANENEADVYDNATLAIAKRLLNEETLSQAKVDKLGIKIHKGVLVVSLVKHDNNRVKIVISKAENDEFLDDESYKLLRGLPVRKKIYKAFICEVDENKTITKVAIYDTNSTYSVYWWREFLELTETHSDDYNTKKAFDVIEANILTPIKKISKPDYITLWNTTVHYFRCKTEFSMDDFVENTINGYQPFDERIKPEKIEKDIRSLPLKHDFDSKFSIIQKLITKQFKKTIPLTYQIDLQFKEDIPDLNNVIKPYEELDGTKYVMIKSEQGYDYFKRRQNN